MPRFLTFALSAFLLAGGAPAQDRYAIVVPSEASPELVDSAYRAMVRVAYEANADDVVELINGTSPRSISRVKVPEGHRNRRAFLLKQDRQWASAIRFLQTARAEGEKKSTEEIDAVRIPQVLSFLGARGEEARVLLFAHPSYRLKDDAKHVFAAPLLPNDRFLDATREESLFGTRGAEKELAGLKVYFCSGRTDWGPSLYQQQVQRFFGLLVHGRGGSWGGLSADEGELVRNALKGTVPRWPEHWTLRAEEQTFAMRTAEGPVVRKELPPAPPRTVVVLLTDGSISSQQRLAVERDAYLRLSATWAKAPETIEAGLIVFRGAGSHDIYPVAPLTLSADGKPGTGLSGLHDFITAKEIKANESTFARGSEVGVRTGKTVKVSRMEPLGAVVDTAFGIREGLRTLADLRPVDQAYLVICGDVDTGEKHTGKQAEIENKKLVDELRSFSLLNPKARIVALYSGEAKGRAQAFYQSLAAAAGDRGVYLDDAADLEPLLRSLVGKSNRSRR